MIPMSNIKQVIITLLFFCESYNLGAQIITIPEGVIYKYTNDTINEAVKLLLNNEIKYKPNYSLFDSLLFIGPSLWERYKKIDSINNIEAGNVTMNIPIFDDNGNVVSNKPLPGKLIQDRNDFIIVWEQIRSDLSASLLNLRKLNQNELIYYWATINFDIYEPVYIVETPLHKILFQFNRLGTFLYWIDEF